MVVEPKVAKAVVVVGQRSSLREANAENRLWGVHVELLAIFALPAGWACSSIEYLYPPRNGLQMLVRKL